MARRLRQEAGTGGETSPTLVAALATVEREGPLTPSALADHERIQRPTATRVVARLEAAGLVTRTADPATDASRTSRSRARAGRCSSASARSRTEYLARRLRELEPAERATLAEAAAILERLLER